MYTSLLNKRRRNGADMAAYMRSVICLVSIERNAFLTRGSGVFVESKRYVRGLRRKPVRVLFPEEETDKVIKPAPAGLKREKEARVTATTRHLEERDSVKKRSDINVQSTVKYAAVAKDQIDGLRFERAFPGDKRLA